MKRLLERHRPEIVTLVICVVFLAAAAFLLDPIVTARKVQAGINAAADVNLGPGEAVTVRCAQRLDINRNGQNEAALTCAGVPPTATRTSTATPTVATVTPTVTPGGHDVTAWHGPSGQTHEHGAPGPVWLPTSGPCAGVAFAQMAAGRETHNFYKGYLGITDNGVQIYVVNHVAPTQAGRSHGDHDETILVRDRSGAVSCWRGIGWYSPTNNASDPITIFVKPCSGEGVGGPVILVDCQLASESWYEAPGRNWCDNSTHVNGVWQDINGVNRGDGGARHMEISCYPDRLPGAGAIYVAPTLAQDCLVIFNTCQFKAVTPFQYDYTLGLTLAGPN